MVLFHPVMLNEEAFARQCAIEQLRRGGPGGQHRNKVSTGIVLTHLPTGLIAEANERRSQVDNRRVATRRLRELLAIEVRSISGEGPGGEDCGSRELIRATYAGKAQLRVGGDNWERPLVLAMLLDDIYQRDFRLADVASLWGISASQIVRFLKQFPLALQRINQWRAEHQLPPLR